MMDILRKVKKTVVLLHLFVTEKYYPSVSTVYHIYLKNSKYLIFRTISTHSMFNLVRDYKMNPPPSLFKDDELKKRSKGSMAIHCIIMLHSIPDNHNAEQNTMQWNIVSP